MYLTEIIKPLKIEPYISPPPLPLNKPVMTSVDEFISNLSKETLARMPFTAEFYNLSTSVPPRLTQPLTTSKPAKNENKAVSRRRNSMPTILEKGETPKKKKPDRKTMVGIGKEKYIKPIPYNALRKPLRDITITQTS